MVTTEDFVDWKSNPTTKAVLAGYDDFIQKTAGDLAESAGLNPLYDRFRAGYIQGLRDAINVSFDEVDDND